MVLNQQQRIRVPLRELERFRARVCRRLRIGGSAVSVCLVTNAAMASWNRAYRGKPGPTDVLSFPADGARQQPINRTVGNAGRERFPPTGPAHYLGDIAIAPAVAKRNAKRSRRALGDEMRVLILHGILHLMGYDHETDAGEMERRERRLRRELGLV